MTCHTAVITPVCGPLDRVAETIQSVLCEDLAGVDYVVIGDVAELRRRFDGSPRGHAIRWLESGSTDVIVLVNEGLRQTRAPIVSWLLPGDRHFDDSISIAAHYLNTHSDVDVMYGDAVGIDIDGRAFVALNATRWSSKKLRQRCFIRQPAVYLRRSAIESAGALDPSCGRAADYDLWLRLARRRSIFAHLPRLIAAERVAADKARLWPSEEATTVEDFASLAEVSIRHGIRLNPLFLARYGLALAARALPADADDSALLAESKLRADGVAQKCRKRRWLPSTTQLLVDRHLRRIVPACRSRPPISTAPHSRAHRPKWLQFLRKRITRHVHHKPRPMHVPAEYLSTSPPPNPPTISLVTPSFNQAPYLGATIQSVLDQHYPRLEYVVQDGGSKDGSVEILRAHDDRLTAWESRPDGGQSQAINLGLRKATGQIMGYLNSDDLLLPGTLSYVARYFADHPEVDVVYGHRVLIDAQGLEIGRWVLPPHDDDMVAYADFIPQETMFWRRRAWDAVGGHIDESFRFAMDWDLILRFRAAGMRFVRLPRFLGAFRVTAEQKTASWSMTVGRRETERLAVRTHGQTPPRRTVRQRLRRYMRLHYLYDKLYLAGVIHY